MGSSNDPEAVIRKNREKREREKKRRWEQAAEVRKEEQMWREVRTALGASTAAGRPHFLVYWETHDNYRRQWQLFLTREDAARLLHELGRDGAWVRTQPV